MHFSKTSILVISILLNVCQAFAQNEDNGTSFEKMDKVPLFSRNQAVKLSPVLGGYIPVGGMLFFEKGLGMKKISIDLGVRYHAGYVNSFTDSIGNSTTIDSIPEHIRFEIQPRYWMIRQFYSVFIGPTVAVHANGKLAGGMTTGFVGRLSDHLYFEGSLGFITTSIEEFSSDPPIYIRSVWSICYKWKSKEKSE